MKNGLTRCFLLGLAILLVSYGSSFSLDVPEAQLGTASETVNYDDPLLIPGTSELCEEGSDVNASLNLGSHGTKDGILIQDTDYSIIELPGERASEIEVTVPQNFYTGYFSGDDDGECDDEGEGEDEEEDEDDEDEGCLENDDDDESGCEEEEGDDEGEGSHHCKKIHMKETIYYDFTFPLDQHTYDYASIVDFYYGKHPDSWRGGVFIGTNPHWPDSLFWSHTLPPNFSVPPYLVTKAKLWIDAKAVNTENNTVEIQGTFDWDPLNHFIFDNTTYDLTGVSEEGFWNYGSIYVIVRAGESLIRLDEAKLLLDYEDHTDVKEDESSSPIKEFRLSQNYPNPFNPETEISFFLPERTSVSLSVYNVSGQKVRELLNATLPAGSYKVTWDGTDNQGNRLASGVYFSRLSAGGNVSTSKMVLMK